MKTRFLLGLVLLSLSCLARAEDKIFDVHVHIWDGEKSVKAYLAQLESTGQDVTGFGGIHMARWANWRTPAQRTTSSSRSRIAIRS